MRGGRGGAGGGGFGRRPYNQPQMPETPDNFEHVVYPQRMWNFHAHKLSSKRDGGAGGGPGQQQHQQQQQGLMIPSIDPNRAQHHKPANAKLFMNIPHTLFASSEGTREEVSRHMPPPPANGGGSNGKRGQQSSAQRMSFFSTNYFYSPFSVTQVPSAAPTPSATGPSTPLAGTSPVSKGTSQQLGLSSAAGARQAAPNKLLSNIVSSIMTQETNDKVVSSLPQELIIDVDNSATFKIRATRRPKIEKPLRRGGVVTAAPVSAVKPKKAGDKSTAASGSKRNRDAMEGAVDIDARRTVSDDDEVEASDGDTDEMSSIAGDDDEDGDDDGSGDELTM